MIYCDDQIFNTLSEDELMILGEVIADTLNYEHLLDKKEIKTMDIKLYTQEGCPQCEMAKRLLKAKNINFETVLVTLDNVDEMKARGVIHTPTLELDGQKYIAKPLFDKIKEL